MNITVTTLRVVERTPIVVASAAMWIVLIALLPRLLGLAAVAVLAAALTCAWTPSVVHRLATREPSPLEQATLEGALAALHKLGIDRLNIRVSRVATATPVRAVSRDRLVIAPALLRSVAQRRLGDGHVAALLAEASLRAGVDRPQRALVVWTLPWTAILAVVRPVGRVAHRVPFVGLAWRVRVVVGVVAVVQSVADGRVGTAVLVAASVTTTYVVPAARRSAEARAVTASDHEVAMLGLGPALYDVLTALDEPAARCRAGVLLAAPSAPGPAAPGVAHRVRAVPAAVG